MEDGKNNKKNGTDGINVDPNALEGQEQSYWVHIIDRFFKPQKISKAKIVSIGQLYFLVFGDVIWNFFSG